ncbi:uncharacterized protein [Onthophagus taurus]|uniref:uncharacterized protein n=1 Tax=Onthophagus taurus TaxID=166361 RepID=UPI0039BE1762
MSSEAEFSIFTVHELKYISQLFELPEKKRKLEIIKEIINSNYTVDEVKIEIMTWTENPQKGRLEKIEIEKKEKEEKERIERLEIAKLDTEVKLAQFRVQGISENSNFSNSNINSFNMNKYLQPFKDNGDMSLFLINFERVCIQLNCGKETWPLRLTSVLSPAANEVVARLSEEDAKDYDKVRASLLKKYQLTSEVFRAKFRYSKKKFDQSYAEFAYQLKNNFKEWIKCEGICSDINKLIQLICLEKFYSSIPSEMRFWVEDHNKTKSIEEAAEQADVYISKRGPINDRNGYNKFKQEHKTSTQRETNQNNPSNIETESERKGDKRSFDKRRPFKCYACGGIGHFKGSKECPNFKESKENKQVVATLNTKKEVEELFAPYTLKGEINGKEVNILRDSAASYDVVHKNIVKTEHYSGKYVHVRGVLNEESVALPVAVVKLNLPEIGELETEAAVTSNLPNGYSYLLSNRTWEMFSNVDNVQNVFALTRSKSKKLKLEQQSIPVEQNQKNEKHKELREQENKVNEKDKQKKEESVLEEMLIIPKGKTDYDDITKLNPNKLRLLQGGDPTLKEYYDKAEIKEDKNGVKFKILNGILHRRFVDKLGRHYEQVVVPTSLRGKIMDIAHDNMWMGHLGCKKTVARIKQNYWWRQLNKDVKNKIKYCNVCMRVGKSTDKVKAPMCRVPIITEPYKKVNVDIVGPLTKTEKGNRYILTLMCCATKFPDAIPLQVADSESVVKGLLSIFSRVGFPSEIQTDLGRVFVSNLTTEFLEQSGIKIIHSSAYHPQSNAVERFHGVFKRILRALSYEHGKEWDEYIDQALFAVRSAPHAAHGFSPAELCYGRQIRSPLSMLKALWNGRDTNEPVVSYVLKLLERLKNMQEIVEISMKEAQNKSKKYYDKKAKEIIYKEGDKVMIYQPARTNKLQMQWEGPKKVVRKISDTNYILEDLTGRRKQTLIHVNLLKPYYEKPEIVAMYVTSSGEEETEMNIYKLEKKEEATLLATEVLQQSKGIGEFTEEQRMDLENLIGEFPGLFSNRPGRTNLVQHDIALKEERIIRTKPYSQSPRVREIIDEEIDKMLNLGVIKPSDSPYSSPMIIIEIEGKEPRPVIDYRALNAISIPQQHPIPNIEACVERCSNAKYLSLIDVVRAYWQIGMTERASKYAAFITHRGVFEPVTLPFGLQSAPFSFQRLMDKILEGYNEFAEPYLDDIAIHSMTWKDHLKHLRLVFTAMHKAGLTIKAKKCEWGKAQVVYLGHKIGQGYRTPSEAKVAAIKEFRRPVTKKDIRIFLGITGYYNHYIPNYAEIVSPLTDALRKGAKNKVEWDEQKENAFNNLKQELTSSKVLKAPNYKRKFIVQTDCSKRGMGVTLSQRDDDNKEYPVLYLSKKLTEREQAYSASELECAALVWAVNKLKPDLYLTHFIIETDHCPLTWLKQMSNKNARLLRWALSLQTLDFTVVYKPGKMCGNVDSLSRYNIEM